MIIIKVNSEWDLGIPELYESIWLARQYVEAALPDCGLDGTLDDYEDEGLINFEVVELVRDV